MDIVVQTNLLSDVHANQEFQRLLDAIVESEEQRLAVGRALLDTQLEYNSSQQEFANTKFSLEQRVLELEGEHAQELAYMVWPLPWDFGRLETFTCLRKRKQQCTTWL